MENLLEQEFSKGKSIINLPSGEFKESFTINRPCTIIGNNTTLWNEKLPVLIVQSNGVTLKNLRLELTSIAGFESNYSVLKVQHDTIIENVEIFGGVADEQKYYIPRMIHLGKLKSNCENTFLLSVYTPEDCTILSKSNNFIIKPTNLRTGYNDLTIKTVSLDDNSMIYGEILFQSKFNRRAYIDGQVSNEAEQSINKKVYSYDAVDTNATSDILYLNVPKVDTSPKVVECKVLRRGERVNLDNLNLIFKLNYSQSSRNRLDIDPYIFLTDNTNNTRYDEDMVFFGNLNALNMCVCIQGDNSIITDLDKVPLDVQKISICYSIYKGGYNKNFSTVINPIVSIFDLNGNELFKIPLQNLGNLSTVIVAELYRYKNSWKINPVVSGYNGGLPRLCQSFGIDADY
ncbi:MAG: TerD family protein [Oscillospiraceae bacterium]